MEERSAWVFSAQRLPMNGKKHLKVQVKYQRKTAQLIPIILQCSSAKTHFVVSSHVLQSLLYLLVLSRNTCSFSESALRDQQAKTSKETGVDSQKQ